MTMTMTMTDVRLHAHVHYVGRDCDGAIERQYVIATHTGETPGQFYARLGRGYLPDGEGEVHVGDGGKSFTVHEPTEEGYRHYEIEVCEGLCDTDARAYRDHSAEMAGY